MVPLEVEQYRALVEHAPTMVWRSGTDGQCDYFNGTWLAFTGRSLQQELGEGWTAGLHADDLQKCVALYREHFERRQAFEREYRLRRFDGVYRYILDRGVPYPKANGEFGGFMGSCMDIDDRRARELSAAADDFFERSLDNVCVAGFDGYFKRVNPSWTRTLGWTANELLARPSAEFVHPEDHPALLAGRARLVAGAPLGPLINRYRCKDGSYRWFEWRSVAHVDRSVVYATARDITEQKVAEARLAEAMALQEKLEHQLIFADRMASVGTLAAGVAHEINNPLAYVTSNVTLLLEQLRGLVATPNPELLTELIDMATDAQEGAHRIRKIVHGLKTFSRAEEGHQTVFDVRSLLELSANMTFSEIRHRARLVKDYGKTPLIEADEARLGQVFINLLINAAQSLPEGDTVSNEIRIVTSTDAAGAALIEIRDTGSGIPAAIIGRVFDPFFTTKPVGVGTGLGLSICHNLVSAMGGRITVASQEGVGTSFFVALPPAVARVAQTPVAPPKPAAVRATVLVVDDEPAVGIVLGRVLREHDVTVVTTARQALELLATGKAFDVIFSDIMMSEMSGMDFYDELTRRSPDLGPRVVFISGGTFTPVANAFFERVANQRIDKPFDHKQVRELVQQFVRSPTRRLRG